MTNSLDRLGLPLVRVAGTPAQIGRGYGEAAREAIRTNVARYAERVHALGGLDADAVARLGASLRDATARRQPRIAAMLDGVAAGAGCDPAAIYALNARTELLNAAAAAAFARRAGAATPDGGCTVLGLDGGATADGGVLLGQNWDWSPDLADGMLVLATEDERGHAVVTLAEAGMLAKAGLNSAGLGVCVNILATDRDGLGAGARGAGAGGADAGAGATGDALPYHVILRAILESRSFAEGVLVAAGTPRAASLNVLIGAADGGLVDLELVAGDVAWTWPERGALAHANHLEACASAADWILQVPHAAASSHARGERARELLAAAATRADGATERDLIEALRDDTLCVHADDSLPPAQRTATLASVVLDLRERRFAIAAGPPCEQGFVAVPLA